MRLGEGMDAHCTSQAGEAPNWTPNPSRQNSRRAGPILSSPPVFCLPFIFWCLSLLRHQAQIQWATSRVTSMVLLCDVMTLHMTSWQEVEGALREITSPTYASCYPPTALPEAPRPCGVCPEPPPCCLADGRDDQPHQGGTQQRESPHQCSCQTFFL